MRHLSHLISGRINTPNNNNKLTLNDALIVNIHIEPGIKVYKSRVDLENTNNNW